MATKSKPKAKARKGTSAKLDPKMAVVTNSSRTRHIGTNGRYPNPLCGEVTGRYDSWFGSKSIAKHRLPICKKCIKAVYSLHAALENDSSVKYAGSKADEALNKAKDGYLDLLSEYGLD